MGVRPNSPPQTTMRRIQQSALLQILDQSRGAPDRWRGKAREPVDDVVVRCRLRACPIRDEELHKPHAALHQPARHQTIVGERVLARRRCRTARECAPVSFETSISSGTLVCMRYAIS